MLARFFLPFYSVLERIPTRVLHRVGDQVGALLQVRGSQGSKQLARNLQHFYGRDAKDLFPDSRKQLLRTNLQGYMRYFADLTQLGKSSPEQIKARVRIKGANEEELKQYLSKTSIPLALTHSGNWDLAGYWSQLFLAPILTVAEKVNPPELLEAFLRIRRAGGMEILPISVQDRVFSTLVELAKSKNYLVPLLADRDIAGGGIPVTLGKTTALVAAGPAALACELNAPLYVAHIHEEKLDPQRAKIARCNWGIVIEFSAPILPQARTVVELTQLWASQATHLIAKHPQSWHMLQKLYLSDLDPARLSRAQAKRKHYLNQVKQWPGQEEVIEGETR